MLCRQERPLPNLDPSGGRCSLLLYYTSYTLSPDILGFKQHNTKQFVLSSIMWKMWILVHILLCCHLASRSIIATEIVHMVHWNQSNPLFFDSPDSRIDIQNSGKWNLYEQANIICPFYDTSVPLSLTEQWVIYNVTKNEYKQCRVTSTEDAKIVALCNAPYQPKFFTLTFRSFSPTPGAFEFHPGQDYYFISAQYSISSTKGQRARPNIECSHPPMRLIFRIQDVKDTDSSSLQTSRNRSNTTTKEVEEEEKEDHDPLPIISSLNSSSRLSFCYHQHYWWSIWIMLATLLLWQWTFWLLMSITLPELIDKLALWATFEFCFYNFTFNDLPKCNW